MHRLAAPVVLVLALVGALIIPRRFALKSASIANLWLALGIHGIGVPGLYTIAASRRAGFARPGKLVGRAGLSVLIGLASISLLAIAWSPDPWSAASAGVEWAALAASFAASAASLQERGLLAIPDLMAWAIGPALVQAASTALFRLRPDLEQRYYLSSLGRLILGTTARGLYDGTAPNNVTELGRAGGLFFVNCNRATMAMGVLLLGTLAARVVARRARFTVVAIALALGIVAANSKTGLALLLVLPACALIASRLSRKREAGTKVTIIALVGVAGYFGANAILSRAGAYVAASENTLVPRRQLWAQAIEAIRSSPLRGLGFGGWEARWNAGGVPLNFSERPVHDWFLQSWLDAGIVNTVLSVALVALIVACGFRVLRLPVSREAATVYFLSTAAVVWVTIHGLGDNTNLAADPVCLVPYAMALGVVLQPELMCDSSLVRETRVAGQTPGHEMSEARPRI